MDKKNWQKLESILDRVLQFDSDEERKQFVEDAGEKNQPLFHELTEIFASIQASEQLWNDLLYSGHILMDEITYDSYSALNATAGNIKHTRADRPESIGGYTLKKLLARGGMGDVYLAGRIDEKFHQTVALKIFRRSIGPISDDRIQRFIQERQILSSLDHPNIARLIDGGVTEDGRPYFVMEYVDGMTITQYCKQQNCSLKERLSLFIQVCKAVEYAHNNFIVHRDLKPDNLMVNRNGTVKVLDFGIAKLLNQNLTEYTLLQTKPGQQFLSLNYAAPEQITLEPVTTATDVYTLGLLLFEMLTDTRAFSLTEKKIREAEWMIRHQDAPKPSAVSAKWNHLLRGDLDAIVMKALRKEPAHRYRSVDHLSDDIRRHLNSHPVSARKGTLRYRLNKFAKRNKGLLVACFFFLITVAGFALWHVMQITEQRNIAQIEAEKAELTSNFLIELLESGNPYDTQGDTLTVLEIIDRGALQAGTLADQPEVHAQVLHTIGNVYFQLHRYDKALPLINQALEIRKSLFSDMDLSLNETRFLLGSIFHNQGNFSESRTIFQEMIDAYRRRPEIISTEVATGFYYLANIHFAMRDYENAEQLYRESLDIHAELLGNNHISTAQPMAGLAASLRQQHKPEEAEELYLKTLQIYRNNESPHSGEAEVLFTLGRIAEQKRDLEAAEQYFRDAVSVYRHYYGTSYPNTGIILTSLAEILRDQGKHPEAEQTYNEAIRLLAERYGENYSLIGNIYVGKARMFAMQNMAEKAGQLFKEGIIILSGQLGSDHLLVTQAQTKFGEFLTKQHRFEEAEQQLLQSFSVNEARAHTNPRYLYTASETAKILVHLYEAGKRPNDARVYRQYLATWENE